LPGIYKLELMSNKPANLEIGKPPDSGAAPKAQVLYLESLSSQLTGWDHPEERVARALRDDEFILYGQSILPIAARSKSRTFLEILVRLQEEETNLTPPGAFIPIMEHYNLMPALDRWIMDHVLAWCASRGLEKPTLCSINLSNSTIADVAFPTFVRERLAVRKVAPGTLCFEVSESDAITKAGVRFVAKIKAMGCLFAIGSFGRGVISFKALRTVSADFVKIDGGIVREIDRDPVANAKVQAITRVCKQFGMATVAEFVETPEILNILRKIGVSYVQGFGISKPGPISAFD